MAIETQSAPTSAAASLAAAIEPQCTLCSGNQVYRLERQGPLEKWVYSALGYFPWRCNVCRTKIYLRKRFRGDETAKRYVD